LNKAILKCVGPLILNIFRMKDMWKLHTSHLSPIFSLANAFYTTLQMLDPLSMSSAVSCAPSFSTNTRSDVAKLSDAVMAGLIDMGFNEEQINRAARNCLDHGLESLANYLYEHGDENENENKDQMADNNAKEDGIGGDEDLKSKYDFEDDDDSQSYGEEEVEDNSEVAGSKSSRFTGGTRSTRGSTHSRTNWAHHLKGKGSSRKAGPKKVKDSSDSDSTGLVMYPTIPSETNEEFNAWFGPLYSAVKTHLPLMGIAIAIAGCSDRALDLDSLDPLLGITINKDCSRIEEKFMSGVIGFLFSAVSFHLFDTKHDHLEAVMQGPRVLNILLTLFAFLDVVLDADDITDMNSSFLSTEQNRTDCTPPSPCLPPSLQRIVGALDVIVHILHSRFMVESRDFYAVIGIFSRHEYFLKIYEKLLRLLRSVYSLKSFKSDLASTPQSTDKPFAKRDFLTEKFTSLCIHLLHVLLMQPFVLS